MDWFLYDNGLRHGRVNVDDKKIITNKDQFMTHLPQYMQRQAK